MKIIKLQAENIKKIKAIEIEPKENMVLISGKNGQGKTSVLDSIWMALGGTDGIPEKTIREGEKRAEVTIDLGEMIVTRKWTSNDKSYLQITNKDGSVFPSPQKMLDQIIGDLSFNPLDFAGAEKTKQVELLLRAIQIPPFRDKLQEISKVAVQDQDVITAFNRTYKTIFDDRTIANRELKNIEAKLDDIKIPAGAKDAEPVNVAELYHARDELKDQQNTYNQNQAKITDIQGQISRLQAELAVIQAKQRNISIDDIAQKLQNTESRIANADAINKAAGLIKTKKDLTAELKAKQAAADDMTDRLEAIKKFKDDLLAQSKMPVPGLDFHDDGVTYNDIPFRQLSASEQLKISLAIAMALNPELKVIRITDGSLLDSDSMKIIETMAKAKDFQVWVEVVDDTGKLGIYIEEGEVKNG